MYKIKEIAEILNVSDRTVERYLKSYITIEKGALLAQFEADGDGQIMGMGHYIYGACITVVVVFTFKVKMFSTVTSYITGFFS